MHLDPGALMLTLLPTRSPGASLRVTLVVLISVLFFAGHAYSAGKGSATSASGGRSASNPTIVIGFVGGFVHRNDIRHAEVQLAEKLRAQDPDHTHAEIFENHHKKQARQAILELLDTNGDGSLSDAQKHRARIILYGHSWGGSAVITLARELQREGIAVLLTIQVDSIEKRGQEDRIVPANVAQAINFYQTHGVLHGRTEIVAADPTHTEILGNFQFDYKKVPKECSAYPWFDRHLFKGHTAIECDPRVWSQIETLIKTQLFAGKDQPPQETALYFSK